MLVSLKGNDHLSMLSVSTPIHSLDNPHIFFLWGYLYYLSGLSPDWSFPSRWHFDQETFDSSKPVTSEDIRAVFENLAKKKKQRLS